MDIVVDTVVNNRIDVPRKIFTEPKSSFLLKRFDWVIKCNGHFCLITQSHLLNLKVTDLGFKVRMSPLLRHHSRDQFLRKLKTWEFVTAGTVGGWHTVTFKCELPVQGESYVRAFSSGQFFSTIAVLFHKRADAKAFLSGARFTGSRSFAFSGSGFAQILGQNVSIREKTLSNTDLFASRHIKRKRSHFHLTYVPQKRFCLSSLSYVLTPPPPKSKLLPVKKHDQRSFS